MLKAYLLSHMTCADFDFAEAPVHTIDRRGRERLQAGSRAPSLRRGEAPFASPMGAERVVFIQ